MNAVIPLTKFATGITGFDRICHGGLPAHRTTLVVGGPGCGKTIFALQTLVMGVVEGQRPGIFVTFEEGPVQIRSNAASFGWDLGQMEDGLFLLDARPSPAAVDSGDFDLNGLLAMIAAKAEAMGAVWVVFDGVDVLLTLLQNPHREMQEIYRIRDWLEDTGLTGMITAKATDDMATPAHLGMMQFMADCTIRLQRSPRRGITAHTLRIIKYRGSGFKGSEHPVCIGPGGMEVLSTGSGEMQHEAFSERVSIGVDSLDKMLNGGIYRGSSSLLTGAPGTAKTTLCAAFVEAACRRGEQALFVSFDEGAEAIARNLKSVGMDLKTWVASGQLRMYSMRVDSVAESHVLNILSLVDEHRATCVVIDPLSALARFGGMEIAREAANRLIYLLKERGVTTMLTALVDGSDPGLEAADLQISTIADTWIHLSYLVRAGERNRALTIIKSRGTGHSNQVRELVLTENRPTLADVYTRGGEVLMGTLRYEREAQDRALEAQRLAEYEHKREELESSGAITEARITALQCELQRNQADLKLLNELHGAQRAETHKRERDVRELRGGEPEAQEPGDE